MKYYTSGEFSKLTGFTNKALRIYDEKGLLKPAYVDPDTNYRYYTNLNLIDSNMIRELKDLGLRLDEIKNYLSQRSSGSLKKLYSRKMLDVNNEIAHLQSIASFLEARLKSSPANRTENVILKNINERIVVFTRKNMPCNPESFAQRYFELLDVLRKHKVGFTRYMAVFHDEPEIFNPANADIEVAAEVKEVPSALKNYRIMKEGLYLTLVFKGKYSELIEGYKKIMNFAALNNFVKNGPSIEVYYTDFITEKNQENFITELQVSVKSALNVLTQPQGQTIY